jgi:hypothetical protein
MMPGSAEESVIRVVVSLFFVSWLFGENLLLARTRPEFSCGRNNAPKG